MAKYPTCAEYMDHAESAPVNWMINWMLASQSVQVMVWPKRLGNSKPTKKLVGGDWNIDLVWDNDG